MSLPDAVLTMIRAAVPAVTVYDGQVPDDQAAGVPPERYVAVYLADPTRAADNVEHTSTGGTLRWQVTSVAPDRGMASWLASQIRDALVDARPTAAGWSAGLIEHTLALPPRVDEQVQERPAVVAVDQYVLLAEQLT